ncbi:MAG: hypothetical protein R3Y55_03680 [Rikenellaceae bacterium]
MDKQNLEHEVEYLRWRECPQWYCLEITYHNNGKIEGKITEDEETKMPLVLQQDQKPHDGVYETAGATTYYTYHMGYAEALKQMGALSM